jgi:NAD(P)-dependent dehydrogenase (short-subunit alcohol dehydrogenase family)
VTGGAGTLGLEAARALLEHGASGVALFDLAASFASEKAQKEIAGFREVFKDRKVLLKVVDVTDEAGVAMAVEECVVEFWGGVQILLCFAGIVDCDHAENVEVDAFRRVVDVNTTGSWICAQAVGRYVQRNRFYSGLTRSDNAGR